ncbi:MAG TPA: hypothetical protein VD794_13815 [Flavisolibacter sp.]|nr:hypothetical protein [Flavisolibacter sp.]
MREFQKNIVVEGGSLTFAFNRIFYVGGVKYFVCVIDKDAKGYFFNMEQRGDRWQVLDAPKVPQWIKDIEADLAATIKQALEEYNKEEDK